MLPRLRSLLGAVLLGAFATLGAAASTPLKVAFVYVGPISDGGWSQQHHLGKLAIEEAYGPRIETTYVESVPETADAERVLRELAAKGYSLIFATSFGYMEPTLKVAKLFPRARFEHATGYKTAANVVTYEARSYEGAYLLGVIAGRMTKSHTLGFVGSFPIPEVIRNIDAFTLGARSVEPRVHTRVVWVDSWYDPGKERQAAEALIAAGADVLAQNTDSPATVQVAEEKGVYAFGWDSDMRRFGPHAELAASTEDWAPYYRSEVRQALEGSWTGNRAAQLGMREGAVIVSGLNPIVPAEVARLVDARRQAIIAGTLLPFAGPLRDGGGTLRKPAGSALSGDELAALNWYVEGVDGVIPK